MVKISIIIPTYNQSGYINRTLCSVKAQTMADWECIIVNDGSLDNTEQVVKNFIKDDGRFRYICQENKGPSAARNAGIAACSGGYISFLDSDDLWEASTLETMSVYLDSHPSIDIVCGAWDYIDESDKPISRITYPKKSTNYHSALLFRNLFPIHTLLVRRGVFDKCGVFDANLISLEDWDLWLRVASYGFKFDSVDDLVAHYRRHDAGNTLNYKRVVTNTFKCIDKAFILEQNRRIRWIKPFVIVYQLFNILLFEVYYVSKYSLTSLIS